MHLRTKAPHRPARPAVVGSSYKEGIVFLVLGGGVHVRSPARKGRGGRQKKKKGLTGRAVPEPHPIAASAAARWDGLDGRPGRRVETKYLQAWSLSVPLTAYFWMNQWRTEDEASTAGDGRGGWRDRGWLDGWRGGMSGRTDVGRCSSPAQGSPISRTLPEQHWEVWKYIALYMLASHPGMPAFRRQWPCVHGARRHGVPAVDTDGTPSDGEGGMPGLQLAWPE